MKRVADVVTPRTEKVLPNDCPELEFIGLDDIEAQTMRLMGTKKAEDMKSSAKRFYPGDVLYSRLRPYLNKVWCANRDGICSSEFIVLPGNDQADPKFLALRLNASDFVSFANSLNLGDRPRVDFSQISQFPFPAFTLKRQQAIVARIETLFSELDKGIEALKTARAQLKVYRQAALKHAFEGKLTAHWRSENPNKLKLNVESSRRQKHQVTSKSAAEDSSLPQEWDWVELKALVTGIDQGWSPKCENHPAKNGCWGVIKTTAIQHGHFFGNENKALPASMQPRPQHQLSVGDILITRAGPRSRVGVCCLVRKVRAKLMNCDKVYRLRALEKYCLPEYLELALNIPLILDNIEKTKSGINDSGVNLNQGQFLNLEIPLCSIEEQRQILTEIEQKISVISYQEELIDREIQHAETLRQSILKKAFSGQLVPQDPNDEQAALMLERIRATEPPKQKTPRKTKEAA